MIYWILIIFLIVLGVLIFLGKIRYDKNQPLDILYNIKVFFGNTSLEKEVIKSINEERVKLDLKPLIVDTLATSIAELRCLEIMDDFSHDGFSNHTGTLVLAGADGFGENLAFGYTTSLGVVRAWMTSEGHKHNILHTTYDAFGLKMLKNNQGRYYWANIFINENKIS